MYLRTEWATEKGDYRNSPSTNKLSCSSSASCKRRNEDRKKQKWQKNKETFRQHHTMHERSCTGFWCTRFSRQSVWRKRRINCRFNHTEHHFWVHSSFRGVGAYYTHTHNTASVETQNSRQFEYKVEERESKVYFSYAFENREIL